MAVEYVLIAVWTTLVFLAGMETQRRGLGLGRRPTSIELSTPAEPPPPGSLELLRRSWQTVIATIHQKSQVTAKLYEDARPILLSGSTLVLEFPLKQSGFVDIARRRSFATSLADAIQQVCGFTIAAVETVLADDTLPPRPVPAPPIPPRPDPMPAPRLARPPKSEPRRAQRAAAQPAPRGGAGGRRSNSVNRPWDTDGGSFRVRRVKDTLTLANGDEEQGSLIVISGSISVPRAGKQVAIITRLLDITDGDGDEALPVLCSAQQFRDEDGEYVSIRTDKLPHRENSFQDLTAAIIPDERIHAARRGQRRFRVIVAFTDADDHDDVLAIGWSSFSYTEREVGYEEWGRLEAQLERHVADIGLAASAADGTLDRIELELIRDFFSDRLGRRDDADRLKSEVSAHLREVVAALRSKTRTPSQLIREAAAALREDGPARRAAFELAAQVVAADDEVGPAEDQVLIEIASALQLDESTIREIRDKVIRLEMLTDVSEAALLGMPAGLGRNEQLDWLSREFDRWRHRAVNAKDDERKQEAEARMKRLSQLRQKVQEGP